MLVASLAGACHPSVWSSMWGMQEFTAWGLLSGAFFVISMASTLFAINLLGLSTASGVWCGIAGELCRSLDTPASFPCLEIAVVHTLAAA